LDAEGQEDVAFVHPGVPQGVEHHPVDGEVPGRRLGGQTPTVGVDTVQGFGHGLGAGRQTAQELIVVHHR
jgi:hypothetical protein